MQGRDKPTNQKAFGANLDDLQILRGPKDGDGQVTRRGAHLKGAFERRRGEARAGCAADPHGALAALRGRIRFPTTVRGGRHHPGDGQ